MQPHQPGSSRTVPSPLIALASAGLWLLVSSCRPAPTPPPPATPAPASPSPVVAQKKSGYDGIQQNEYEGKAKDAFLEARETKRQAYFAAYKELLDAGGLNAKGLVSKDAITARHALIAKAVAANEDYLNFVRTQEDSYRAELAKTPLTPDDINSLVAAFAPKANTAGIVKLREAMDARLKAEDEVVSTLEKSFGRWTIKSDGSLKLEKKADLVAFTTVSDNYNKLVAAENLVRQQFAPATPSPSPTDAGATPADTVAPPPPAQ